MHLMIQKTWRGRGPNSGVTLACSCHVAAGALSTDSFRSSSHDKMLGAKHMLVAEQLRL